MQRNYSMPNSDSIPHIPYTSIHRIEVDGVSLFYREAGPKDAPGVLLLHEFPTSSFQYRHLIPRLADRYHVIALKSPLPFCGQMTTRFKSAVQLFLISLSCALLPACGGGVGNSSGISIAAPSALSYPSPVNATVGAPIALLSPTVNGTVTSYSVSPALPAGLLLNTTTGVITGIPSVATAKATYTITAANAGGSTAFGLSLTVNAAGPSFALSASSLTFANQLALTISPAQTIALINTGTMSFPVESIGFSGSGFAGGSNNCQNVAPNATCLITVTFNPDATGSFSDSLIIRIAGLDDFVVNLFGVAGPIDLSFDHPIIPVGQSATLRWSAPNATSCSASGSWSGSQPTSGTQSVTPITAGYSMYTLTCAGSGTTSTTLTAYGPTPTVAEPANELGYQGAFYVAPPNQVVGLQSTLTVPPAPPVPANAGAALFLWPGLDPATNSVNFLPINNGVLQPVLSWGPSCAPISQPVPFSSWWISGQYVNTFGNDPGYTGCFSGNSMLVNPGDFLLLNISLDPTSGVWLQTVTDSNTNQSVTFSMNMQGQGQNWSYFAMEEWYGAVINTPVTFTNTTITFQSPDSANWCSPSQGANNAYIMTPPTPQNSGTQCFIGSVVLTQ